MKTHHSQIFQHSFLCLNIYDDVDAGLCNGCMKQALEHQTKNRKSGLRYLIGKNCDEDTHVVILSHKQM